MSVDIDHTKLNTLRKAVDTHYQSFQLEGMSVKEFEAWVRLFVNLVIDYQHEKFSVANAETIRDALKAQQAKEKGAKP